MEEEEYAILHDLDNQQVGITLELKQRLQKDDPDHEIELVDEDIVFKQMDSEEGTIDIN